MYCLGESEGLIAIPGYPIDLEGLRAGLGGGAGLGGLSLPILEFI